MKTIIESLLIAGFTVSTIVYAKTKAPDDIVTKADINKHLKHIRKTEDFLYPQFLKVETAKYTIEDTKILLTLSISEKTEYSGSAGVQDK